MHEFDSQGVRLQMYVTLLLRVDLQMCVLSPKCVSLNVCTSLRMRLCQNVSLSSVCVPDSQRISLSGSIMPLPMKIVFFRHVRPCSSETMYLTHVCVFAPQSVPLNMCVVVSPSVFVSHEHLPVSLELLPQIPVPFPQEVCRSLMRFPAPECVTHCSKFIFLRLCPSVVGSGYLRSVCSCSKDCVL